MYDFVLESVQLTQIASEINTSYVGKHIMQSLREQRQENILCDVIIQCGDEQLMAHRTVLYSISEYCRKVFTGPLKVIHKDGKALMDLSSFSVDTVKMFLDLIYGEEDGVVVNVNIAELLQLADFLQAYRYIDILCEVLRRALTDDNCVVLYELACLFNSDKLKRILVSYICGNLSRLIKSQSWEIFPTDVLSSLQRDPLFLSQPAALIGTDIKEQYDPLNFGYALLAYEHELTPSAESDLQVVKSNSIMPKINHDLISKRLSNAYVFYFIFNNEFYAILSMKADCIHRLFKYEQHSRDFSLVLELMGVFGVMVSSEANVAEVISTVSDKYLYIVFHPMDSDDSDLLLVKLNMENSCEPSLEYEVALPNMREYPGIASCQECIFFFYQSMYFTYDTANETHDISLNFTRHIIDEPVEFPQYWVNLNANPYCGFQEKMYALLNVPWKLQLFYLDEEQSSWVSVCEQLVDKYVQFVKAVSSPTDLIFVLDTLENEPTGDEEEYVYGKLIYRYNPGKVQLELWDDSDIEDGRYLFVPDHLLE